MYPSRAEAPTNIDKNRVSCLTSQALTPFNMMQRLLITKQQMQRLLITKKQICHDAKAFDNQETNAKAFANQETNMPNGMCFMGCVSKHGLQTGYSKKQN